MAIRRRGFVRLRGKEGRVILVRRLSREEGGGVYLQGVDGENGYYDTIVSREVACVVGYSL